MTNNPMESFQQIASGKNVDRPPNLWKEARTEVKPLSEPSQVQVEAFIKKVFWKVGKDSFGLESHEIDVRFTPKLNATFKLMGGPTVQVFWSLLPFDPAFKETLHNCLGQVKRTKRSTAIQALADINKVRADVKLDKKLLDVAVKPQEVITECYRVVRVTHKKSGLVSTKLCEEKKGATWSRLITQARIEIGQVIEKIEEGKEDAEDR